jgi:hypothetical protein
MMEHVIVPNLFWLGIVVASGCVIFTVRSPKRWFTAFVETLQLFWVNVALFAGILLGTGLFLILSIITGPIVYIVPVAEVNELGMLVPVEIERPLSFWMAYWVIKIGPGVLGFYLLPLSLTIAMMTLLRHASFKHSIFATTLCYTGAVGQYLLVVWALYAFRLDWNDFVIHGLSQLMFQPPLVYGTASASFFLAEVLARKETPV